MDANSIKNMKFSDINGVMRNFPECISGEYTFSEETERLINWVKETIDSTNN